MRHNTNSRLLVSDLFLPFKVNSSPHYCLSRTPDLPSIDRDVMSSNTRPIKTKKTKCSYHSWLQVESTGREGSPLLSWRALRHLQRKRERCECVMCAFQCVCVCVSRSKGGISEECKQCKCEWGRRQK